MVEDTQELRNEIAEWNKLYCDKLGIKNDHEIIMGRQEIEKYLVKHNIWYSSIEKQEEPKGWFYRDHNTICLNIHHKQNPSKYNIQYTLAHELIHKKYPGLRHGNQFDELVGTLILGSVEEYRKVVNIDTDKLSYDEYSDFLWKEIESYRHSRASEIIPTLCNLLKQENPELSLARIRIKIVRDLKPVLPERIIRQHWPDWMNKKKIN